VTQVPASSHGGGTFDGGTITQPLDVRATNNSPYIRMRTAGTTYGATLLSTETSDTSQHVTLAAAGAGTLIASGGAAAATDIAAFLSANPGQSVDILSITNSGGSEQSGFNKNGYFYTNRHTAPADAELAAGQLLLWFDQTNGAAKLMAKGKTADGTVVAASVAMA
jgi:hypothetical protein